MPRLIFHVDINSYFATMLQQENPALRGKPIGVVKDKGRTCIIASSNEAKRLGIKTGCRAKEAKLLCPNIILIPANFDLFLSATHRLKKIFCSLSPSVDIFSLDEAFLDMTDCEMLMKQSPELFGQLIQLKIKQELGDWVQCNVGISHNKLLAKMASEIGAKGSVSTISNDNLIDVLSTVNFGDVCGIGFRLEQKLNILGIHHPYQINLLDQQTLLNSFGPFWTKELQKIASGEETHFFIHEKKADYMQSVGRSITGYKLCDDESIIKQTLLNLTEEAAFKLRHMNLVGRKVGVSLSGHNGHWASHLSCQHPLKHTNEIFQIIFDLYKAWKRDFSVIKYGIWIGGLVPESTLSLSLLPNWNKQQSKYLAIDAINQKFGLFTIRPATLTHSNLIRPEVTGFLGDKTYQGL